MKRILILHYSQTGQLTRAVKSMVEPLKDCKEVELVWQELKPKKKYPFPWPILSFFDAFPESVYMDPPEMEEVDFDPDSKFDLILLTYQVWFLSPALPITGFLKSKASRVLKDTPVITFIACRGMWLSAQEKMKEMVKSLGGILIDNVVLIDQGPQWTTFVTMPLWLLTGKKIGIAGIIPPAGVSDKDIKEASRFGRALADSLQNQEADLKIPLLKGLGAVSVNPKYIAGEKIAHRSFRIWGKLFRAIGGPGHPLRKPFLVIYIFFLIFMILTVMPAGALLRAMIRPFFREKLNQQVATYEEPSGSDLSRMSQYN